MTLLLAAAPAGTGGVTAPPSAATFVLSMEAGAKVRYSFGGIVDKSWNGTEQRVGLFSGPRQSYDCAVYTKLDSGSLDVRSNLLRSAARGQTFDLALPYEEITLSADSVGAVVSCAPWTIANCDWAIVGQRVIVANSAMDASVSGVIMAIGATTLTLDVVPGVIGKAGGRIMPTVPIVLDPAQGFGRYPVTAELWQVKGRGTTFGFSGVDTMGVGATVNTFDGLAVWDRRIGYGGRPAADSLHSLAEIIDYGGIVTAKGAAPVVDWGRELRLYSDASLHPQGAGLSSEWQWWKAFISNVRGRHQKFLLPTWRIDLQFVSKTNDTNIVVNGKPTLGAGDPLSYWNFSAAHKWIQIETTDGSVIYAKIGTMGDNGNGTVNVGFSLGSLVGKVPQRISWLEQCRFEYDDFDVTWDGHRFLTTTLAHVVQQ